MHTTCKINASWYGYKTGPCQQLYKNLGTAIGCQFTLQLHLYFYGVSAGVHLTPCALWNRLIGLLPSVKRTFSRPRDCSIFTCTKSKQRDKRDSQSHNYYTHLSIRASTGNGSQCLPAKGTDRFRKPASLKIKTCTIITQNLRLA